MAIVQGRVLHADGSPANSVQIELYEINDPGGPHTRITFQNTGSTDGSYMFDEVFGSPKDIFVEVASLSAKSRVVFGAADSETVTIDVLVDAGQAYQGRSQWERLDTALTPVLGAALAKDLTGDDVEILAQRGTVYPPDAGLWVQAHRLADATATPDDISADVFYGLCKHGMPTTMAALLARGAVAHDHALRTAYSNNTIQKPGTGSQADIDTEVATIVGKLKRWNRDLAIASPGAGHVNTRTVLSYAVGTDTVKMTALIDAWLDRTGTAEQFWSDVEGTPPTGLTAAEVTNMKFALQAGAISGANESVIKELTLRHGVSVNSIEDVADYDEADWDGVFTAQGITDAPSYPGATATDRLDAYKQTMMRLVEDQFPTRRMRHKLNTSTITQAAGVEQFLIDNTDYDLATTNFWAYKSGATFNATDPNGDNLKKVQRVHNLSPKFDRAEVTATLVSNDVASAQDIVRMGRDAFVAKFEPLFTNVTANASDIAACVFANAQSKTGVTHALMMALGTHPANPQMPMFQTIALNDGLAGMADLETLFGSVDFCACEHCRSVLSPAAYLVDLLEFLKNRESDTAGTSALVLLLQRRADIADIDLNCDNTNTVMPYIDLVNEVLETEVGGAPATPHQTTLSADELRANPEHTSTTAYTTLAAEDNVFPWTQPFDINATEQQAYFTHLGVPRHTLMSTLQEAGAPTNEAITAEVLGMTPGVMNLVTGTYPQGPPAVTEQDLWGGSVSATNVPDILARSGLSFEELDEILQYDYINMPLSAPAGTCDLDDYSIPGATTPDFTKIHNIVRVHRASGIPLWELNAALEDLGSGSFDVPFLTKLANFRILQGELGVDTLEMLGWFADLNTTSDATYHPRSYYDDLFQNPAVLQPVDGDFAYVDPDLFGSGAILPGRAQTIQAALRISEAELRVIIDNTTQLNLANVSQIARHVSLARALGLTIADLASALTSIGGTPFATPSDMRAFVADVRQIQRSGFSMTEIEYVLRHTTEANAAVGDDSVAATNFLEELSAALAEIESTEARQARLDEKVADHFDMDRAAANELLTAILDDGGVPTSLAGVLTDPAFVGAAPTTAQFDAYAKVHKAALVMARLGLRSFEDVQWFFGATAPGPHMDVNALPMTIDTPTPAAFSAWRPAGQVAELRAALGGPGDPHSDAVGAINQTASIQIISDASGWDKDDVTTLVGRFAPGSNAVDLHAPSTLLAVRDSMTLVNRIGVDAATLVSWATVTPDAAQTKAIKLAVKAKHGDAAWKRIGPELRDELREKQRTALAEYVVQSDATITSVEDLYGEFLIDTEMSSCALTSRIKQAVASVQLFIHRAQLGLEADLSFTEAAKREYEWMRNYRVWEANRKVFLFPENWIEPELRDDKSPLFKQLEQHVRQGDVTPERVQDALRDYVVGLDEVANLEIVGIAHETPDGKPSRFWRRRDGVVHVIGRTTAAPHVYYYRQRVDDSYWTPWEEMPVDIEADQVVITPHRGRLFFIWLDFESINVPTAVQGEDDTWLIPKIGWAVRRGDRWSRKHMGPKGKAAIPERMASVVFMRAAAHDPYGANELAVDVVFYGPNGGNSGRPERFRFDDRTQTFVYDDSGSLANGVSRAMMGIPKGGVPGGEHYELTPQTDYLEIPGKNLKLQEREDDRLFDKIATKSPGLHTGVKVIAPRHFEEFSYQAPFAFGDRLRTLYVFPEEQYRLRALTPHLSDPQSAALENVFLADPPSELPLALDTKAPDDVPRFLDAIETPQPFAGTTPGAGAAAALGFGSLTTEGFAFDASGLLKTGADFADAPATVAALASQSDFVWEGRLYRFDPLFHPYASEFLEVFSREGVDALLAPTEGGLRRQQSSSAFMVPDYDPTPEVVLPYPKEEIDFSYGGAYSGYNWELFFHAPVMIADRLRRNRKFDDARRWFHYVFDPLAPAEPPTVGAEQYWNIRPFYENAKDGAAKQFEVMLGVSGTPDEQAALRREFAKQVKQWRKEPFRPHLIARLRPGAYERWTVLRYIDNLIEWGDDLFKRDTVESINEATQLYVLASAMLGPRPDALPEHQPQVRSYNDIVAEGGFDAFGNALVDLESFPLLDTTDAVPLIPGGTEPPLPATVPFFCYPRNPSLLRYWDRVEDRLFKIRHCQNIAGLERQLPLFQPPIDPAILVRAVAQGVDIASAIAGLSAEKAPYRFSVMVAKAIDLAGDVRALGGALLVAIEKKDAEQLAVLRAGHEKTLLKSVRDVRKQQIVEAQRNIEALQAAKATAEGRRAYYATRKFMSSAETQQVDDLTKAHGAALDVASNERIAAYLGMVPDFSVGWAGVGPSFGISFGGGHLARAFGALAGNARVKSTRDQQTAQMAGIMGGHHRRAEEWTFQVQQADDEIANVEKQILAAEIRLEIAKNELSNHDLQVEQSEEAFEFMRSKFSNEELYDWMIQQLSVLHHASFQLAYEIAKRAETSYAYELGLQSASFIGPAYFDSAREGLLAGERLTHDLRRMEASFLENNARELELTKNVSLAQLNPDALVQLRESGTCSFLIPGVVYDLDHPGHYMRRIKSVSLTIPAVAGPYTSVGTKLTLVKSYLHRDPLAAAPVPPAGSDVGGVWVATSSSVNDAGLFEVNFNDDRYLPFEGHGAVSDWTLELPTEVRQFDYSTISDVVLQINYTARFDSTLKATVIGTLVDDILSSGLMQIVSAKRDFPNEWHGFLHKDPAETGNLQMDLSFGKDRFPHVVQDQAIKITQVDVLLVVESPDSNDDDLILTADFDPLNNPPAPIQMTLTTSSTYGDQRFAAAGGQAEIVDENTSLRVEVDPVATGPVHIPPEIELPATTPKRLDPDKVKDLIIIIHYAKQ